MLVLGPALYTLRRGVFLYNQEALDGKNKYVRGAAFYRSEGVKIMGCSSRQRLKALKGKVIGVSDLLNYQDDAVVSREIIKKSTGTITLFAFDKDQGLSEHTAPFDALVFIVDGSAEIVISGKPHRAGRGEMIIMPANKPHALRAVRRFKMLLVMIKK